VEDETVSLETWRSKGYGVSAVRHEMRRRGEQLIAFVTDRLRALGIPSQVTVMRGDPAFLIPFVATKWSSDLILVRAHNRTEFRNWLLGSVAKSIVDSATCSVEIVREPKEHPVEWNRNLRILLATDGSGAALAAVRELAQTSYPEATEVKVVSIINSISYSLEEIGLSRGKQSEHAHRAIGKAVSMLSESPFKVTGEVIAGTKVRQILQRANDWRADLIVIGTQPRSGWKRLLSKDTAARVANGANCSVKVVRHFAENKQLPPMSERNRQDYRAFRPAA
jgi:nucleotide-binding universal stress UspA family protein